jgi:uncharacterized protein (TIGR03000 family)
MTDGAFAPGYAEVVADAPVADWSQDGQEEKATLVINLPEDARLTVDGEATQSTAATRVLVTPRLPQGRDFSYTLEAEVNRDGIRQVVTQTITFRAGEEKQVTLKLPPTVAAAE